LVCAYLFPYDPNLYALCNFCDADIQSWNWRFYSSSHVFYCGNRYVDGTHSIIEACYFFSAYILIHVYYAYPETKTLNELIECSLRAFAGKTFDAIILSLLALVMIYGVQSISQNFYSNFQMRVWSLFASVPKQSRSYDYFNFYFSYIIGVFLLAINFKRSFDSLINLSYASLIIFLIILALCLIQSPFYYEDIKQQGKNTFN